jgi:Bacterial Ig-like domain
MMRVRLIVLTTLAALVVGTVALAGVAWAEGAGAPTVVSTVPTSGATNVDGTANITAKFSEAMKARSINTTTFYLLQGHFTAANPPSSCTTPPVAPSTTPVTAACPAPVAATVSYNADTKTAILDPTASLGSFTEYTAVVEGTRDGDMKAVKDSGGTPMATDYIFYFTTGSVGGNPGRG